MPRGRLIVSVLLPFAAGYFLSYVFRTVNAVIASDLAAELNLNAADLGVLTSVYFLVFAAVQLPLGVLLDRIGPSLVQSILMLFAGAGALVFALADGFLGLMVGRALLGVGVAVALMAGIKAISVWFPSDRSSSATGWLVMLGALGALTATAPADLLVQAVGWRGLFVVLAGLSALTSLLVLFAAPGPATVKVTVMPSATFSTIYSSAHFWRIAPMSALGVGTSWSLQGLWAAPWLRDVNGFERSTIVDHLSVMAMAVCAGALLLGTAADRLRTAGVKVETLLAATLSLSALGQLALILNWPLPPLLPFTIIAAAGAATVLSFAVVGAHFPKSVAGRANAALNLLHVGTAFAVQSATGFLIAQWSDIQGRYPAEAHRSAMATILALQVAALLWFAIPHGSRQIGNYVLISAVVRRLVRPVSSSRFVAYCSVSTRPAKNGSSVGRRSGYLLMGVTPAFGVFWFGPDEQNFLHALSAVGSSAVALFTVVIAALVVSDWYTDSRSYQAWAASGFVPVRTAMVGAAVADIESGSWTSSSREPFRQVLPADGFAAQRPRSLRTLATPKCVLPAEGDLASQATHTTACRKEKLRAKKMGPHFQLVANGNTWSRMPSCTNPRTHRPACVVVLIGSGGDGGGIVTSSHQSRVNARHSTDAIVHDNLGQKIPIRRTELEVIESYLERELRELLTAIRPTGNSKDV